MFLPVTLDEADNKERPLVVIEVNCRAAVQAWFSVFLTVSF